MKIKVNYDKLKAKKEEIRKESEELSKYIDELLSYLPDVEQAWTGNPSKIFVGKADAYFNNMKQLAVSLNAFSDFAGNADNAYYDTDK